MREVVIVGASLAGFSAAEALRAGGFDGTIKLVGDEPVRAYERPPLSKSVLTGDADAADTMVGAATTDDLGLDWLLGERATGLSVADRRITLGSGAPLDFDGLVIATGAAPRRLPDMHDRAGLHVLRSLDDALGLRADLDAAVGRVVVVGAGFIGAEVAASCRSRGHEVTMVDPLATPLERVLGTEVGGVVADRHRAAGVDLRLRVGIDEVIGDDRVEGVRLSDGSVVEAEVVVVGIGVVPNTAWLDGSGLSVDDGVVCDATTLAAPDVVAAGDVARWQHPRHGLIRVEHWDNAVEMGSAAGRRLLATDATAEPYAPVPWFWSDQYDVKIQLAGRPSPDDDFAIVHGSVDDNRFVGLYGRDGTVTAALGWNWPAKVMRYKMRLADDLDWATALADAS